MRMFLWRWRIGKGAGDVADVLDSASEVGPVKRWVYGIGLAALPVSLGVYCLAVGRAWVIGRGLPVTLRGEAAIAMAIVYMSIGGLAHFHFFWSGHPKYWRVARAGKPLSLIAFAGGLLFVVYKVATGL